MKRLLSLLVCIMLIMTGEASYFNASALGSDKPLTQLISEAKAQNDSLLYQRSLVRDKWTKNQNLISDLTVFRKKAQWNTEKGVLTIGARLLKDAMAPLIKNHGYGVANKLAGFDLSPNSSVANTTLRWSQLRDKAVSLVSSTQLEQKSLLKQIDQYDKKIAANNAQIKKWQAAYKLAMSQSTVKTTTPATTQTTATSYDYNGAMAKWMADFTASTNKSKRDEYWGQDHVYTLEFTTAPHLVLTGSSPGVYGAHQIWDEWSYYIGENVGKTGRSTVNSYAMDTPSGGIYISLGELKSKYPEFANKGQTAAPVPKAYDYNAALAQWVSDYTQETNKTRRDEYWGQDHIYTIEFTKTPYLVMTGSAPGVYGAHQIWDEWSYYIGENVGKTGRSTVNSYALESPTGGIYITLSALKEKYPQFGN